MNRPSCLLASALTAGMLLSTAACSSFGDRAGSGDTDVPASAMAKDSPTATTLTQEQAQAALITNSDLGSQWTATQGTATWHDSLLKGKVDANAFVTNKQNAVDCQKLLDGLYAEDLLGDPKGGQAATTFDDSGNNAQMRYQVAGYAKADVDAKLAWLKTLPDKCDQFPAVDAQGAQQNIQVISTSPPNVGDARQGLQITVDGEVDGAPSTLTLDFVAVRVGDSALSLTNGGLEGAEQDSTEQAVQAGTTRLKDVLAGKTPPPTQG
ncbi:lipoprotein [Streptomyces albiflavescens]|uniref:Lipoprotein n=1 Tax=Streptomyces albiflavescens TaxID=1623582 RepID=A0A917Y454_9ACTN|nr:hypothetical protein [Streptomyces albiflavescens]GGN65594.1 lipoprotein [Streptomyces albiflavescens]